MRRVTLAAAAMAAVLNLAAAAPALAAYGAFAHDETTGRYGFSWNEDSQRKADETAMKGCNSPDCKVVFRTGPRECGAIALTDNGKAWGGAKRPKRDAAELAAMENCQKHTKGQCKVKGSECNR